RGPARRDGDRRRLCRGQRVLGAAALRRRLHAVYVRQGQPDPSLARLGAVLDQSRVPYAAASAPAGEYHTAARLCAARRRLDGAADYAAAAGRCAAAASAPAAGGTPLVESWRALATHVLVDGRESPRRR